MEDGQGIFLLLGFILRIVGVIVCTSKAEKLNRSQGGWGIFGFFMPIVAMIVIQFMKPVMVWDENVEIKNETE